MKLLSEFNNCPHCKADARLMNTLVQAEIDKGNMGAEIIPWTFITVYCNIDSSRPPIAGGRVPAARIYKDMCTECGEEFTTRIETGFLTMPLRAGAAPVFS
jgi:glutaredoxin